VRRSVDHTPLDGCNRGGVVGHLIGVESRERFEALYRAHAGAVLAYACRRTDRATADDVVADVFLIVWRRVADVPADPLPWLFGIARRVLANRRRSDARAAALNDRLQATTPLQQAELRATPVDAALERALGALSERDRELLLLVAWDGLDPARAACALGVRPGTFAVRLHRARRRLARLLEAADEIGREDHSAFVEVS
jgi:RNA polymerase sigma-70 factor, ECF subfamily